MKTAINCRHGDIYTKILIFLYGLLIKNSGELPRCFCLDFLFSEYYYERSCSFKAEPNGFPERSPAMAGIVNGKVIWKEKKETIVYIRWLIRRDMPEVVAIENESFEFPWPEEDFLCCLRQRNCIGMSAEYEDRVVGFMIYELCNTQIHVLNFAVARDYRRRGVGRQMISKIVDKLSLQRWTCIALKVSEKNLPAQLFFKACGFRAVSVLRNFYDNSEDAYLVEYRYRQEAVETKVLTR